MKISAEQGTVLLSWARAELRRELGGPPVARPAEAWGEVPAATFVTPRWADDGRLQGCIGSIEARRTLVDDVGENAIAAGLFDPRAERLALCEVDHLDVELSVISPLERIEFTGRGSAYAALRPGIDGVVFSTRHRRATLLPSMWETLPTPDVFMAMLMRKAGCSPDAWSDDVRLWRYTADKHVDVAPARRRAS